VSCASFAGRSGTADPPTGYLASRKHLAEYKREIEALQKEIAELRSTPGDSSDERLTRKEVERARQEWEAEKQELDDEGPLIFIFLRMSALN
jgi:uncharacterized membrane protein (DUF106 family)